MATILFFLLDSIRIFLLLEFQLLTFSIFVANSYPHNKNMTRPEPVADSVNWARRVWLFSQPLRRTRSSIVRNHWFPTSLYGYLMVGFEPTAGDDVTTAFVGSAIASVCSPGPHYLYVAYALANSHTFHLVFGTENTDILRLQPRVTYSFCQFFGRLVISRRTHRTINTTAVTIISRESFAHHFRFKHLINHKQADTYFF